MIAERTLFKKLLATVSASALFSVSSAVANPLDPTVQSGDVTFEGLGSSNVVIGNNSEKSGLLIGTASRSERERSRRSIRSRMTLQS